jgi:hypothetical protein
MNDAQSGALTGVSLSTRVLPRCKSFFLQLEGRRRRAHDLCIEKITTAVQESPEDAINLQRLNGILLPLREADFGSIDEFLNDPYTRERLMVFDEYDDYHKEARKYVAVLGECLIYASNSFRTVKHARHFR